MLGKQIRAILFDLDGTLIDSSQDLADAGNYLRRLQGMQPLSLGQIASYVGDGAEAFVARLLESDDQEQIQRLLPSFKEYYRDHCIDSTTLYQDVKPTLQELARRGYKLAVVTNKPARISKRILEGLGVGPLFEAVIGGDTTPFKKPHSAPMLHACKKLGEKPEHCAMVGDSRVDVEAGRAIHVPCLAIQGGIGDQQLLLAAKPDRLLNSFKALLEEFPELTAIHSLEK